MRGLLLLAACGGLLCGCGGAASAPQPGIVLDHRIGVVRYGEPKSRVEAALGSGKETPLEGYSDRFLFYPRGRIYVVYSGSNEKHAVMINTLASRYKTASGVGVGSTMQELQKGVAVFCDARRRLTTCLHAGAKVTAPLTVFSINTATKRITQISIVRPSGR
jgi:hypothetical protein